MACDQCHAPRVASSPGRFPFSGSRVVPPLRGEVNAWRATRFAAGGVGIGFTTRSAEDRVIIAGVLQVARAIRTTELQPYLLNQLRQLALAFFANPRSVAPVPAVPAAHESEIAALVQELNTGHLPARVAELLRSLGGQTPSSERGEAVLCSKHTQGVGGGFTHSCGNLTCNTTMQLAGWGRGICVLAGAHNAAEHPGCTCLGINPGGRRPLNISWWEWLLLIAIVLILVATPWPDEVLVAGYLARLRAAGLAAGGA